MVLTRDPRNPFTFVDPWPTDLLVANKHLLRGNHPEIPGGIQVEGVANTRYRVISLQQHGFLVKQRRPLHFKKYGGTCSSVHPWIYAHASVCTLTRHSLNWQPTGGLMVQADRLGPKVGGHLAPCCTHRVNQGELSQCCYSMMTVP